MYPQRDFRFLIEQPDLKYNSVVRSISREPFTEVLHYWQRTGRPKDKYQIYCKGIEEAISKNRYPIFIIDAVQYFPEFYVPVKNGLENLWLTLRFSLDLNPETCIYIDSYKGSDINMSKEDKIKLLYYLNYKTCVPLSINGQLKNVGIFTSRKTEQIYQRVYWLNNLLNKSIAIS